MSFRPSSKPIQTGSNFSPTYVTLPSQIPYTSSAALYYDEPLHTAAYFNENNNGYPYVPYTSTQFDGGQVAQTSFNAGNLLCPRYWNRNDFNWAGQYGGYLKNGVGMLGTCAAIGAGAEAEREFEDWLYNFSKK